MSGYWPSSVPKDTGGTFLAVAWRSLGRVAVGAGRLAWWWPGVVVAVAAYVAVAISLYDRSYPNLWGALAATVVGTAWYLSPLRRMETRRRDRLATTPQS